MEQVSKCVDCFHPIRVYNYYCGDQSRCGNCEELLQKKLNEKIPNTRYNTINGEMILR